MHRAGGTGSFLYNGISIRIYSMLTTANSLFTWPGPSSQMAGFRYQRSAMRCALGRKCRSATLSEMGADGPRTDLLLVQRTMASAMVAAARQDCPMIPAIQKSCARRASTIVNWARDYYRPSVYH